MDALETLQFVGSMGFLVSLAPQFVRTLRLRRANDMSVGFLVILLASSAVLLYYALRTHQRWFVWSYTGNLVVWGTVLYFRWFPSPDPNAT